MRKIKLIGFSILLLILITCSLFNNFQDMGSIKEPIILPLSFNPQTSFYDLEVGSGTSYFCITNVDENKTYDIEFSGVYSNLIIQFYNDKFITPASSIIAFQNDTIHFLTGPLESIFFTAKTESNSIEGSRFSVMVEQKNLYFSEGTMLAPIEFDLNANESINQDGNVGNDVPSYYKINLPSNSSIEINIKSFQDSTDFKLFSDSNFQTEIGVTYKIGWKNAYNGISNFSGNALFLLVDGQSTPWGSNLGIYIYKLIPVGSISTPVELFSSRYDNVTKDQSSYYYFSTTIGSNINIILYSSSTRENLRLKIFDNDGTFMNLSTSGIWDGSHYIVYSVQNYQNTFVYFEVDGSNTDFGAHYRISIE